MSQHEFIKTAYKKGLSYFLLSTKSWCDRSATFGMVGSTVAYGCYYRVCKLTMGVLPLASFATTVTMSLHINKWEGWRGEVTHR
jgi:hypothetical protein